MAPVREDSDAGLDGTVLGQSSADKISFYGSTPVVRRASSAQDTSNFASSADFDANQLAGLIEIMNTFQALGLWKGDV